MWPVPSQKKSQKLGISQEFVFWKWIDGKFKTAKFQLVDLRLKSSFFRCFGPYYWHTHKKNMKPRDPNPSVKTKLFFVFEQSTSWWCHKWFSTNVSVEKNVGSRSENQYPNGWIVEQFGKGPSICIPKLFTDTTSTWANRNFRMSLWYLSFNFHFEDTIIAPHMGIQKI